MYVCVRARECVCVCERASQRERESEKVSERVSEIESERERARERERERGRGREISEPYAANAGVHLAILGVGLQGLRASNREARHAVQSLDLDPKASGFIV